jgi:3-oxoacyl-(acyl-carrier-protein) synthase
MAVDLPELRERLVATFPETLSSGVLKQCDELTLVALDAVRQAAVALPHKTPDWGVVASLRSPGRRRMAETLTRFRERGAWGVTPHFIPHSLLHSAPGLIAQALGLRGPSAGFGGTTETEDDALRGAAAWLAGGDLPGAWLVWAGWSRETLASDLATAEAMAAAVVWVEAGPTGGDAMEIITRMAREA